MFLQYELWKDCSFGCKYCFNQNIKTKKNKVSALKYAIDSLHDRWTIPQGSTIGFMGGEFFDGQLRDSEVYTNFTPYGLMIDIYYSEQNTADSLVDFYYCFTYLDSNYVPQAGVFQFKFSEFGNCSVSLLDQVVSGEIQ